jgi:tetratricopeptide (TPR) repeat protein
LELHPSGVPAAETYQRIAAISTEQKRYDDAESELQHAKQNDPGNPGIYYQLGAVYELQGKIERAEENYIKAAEIDPKHVYAYRALGHLYAKQADSKKLAELAQHILGLDLQPAERYQAHVLISNFYQAAKLYELAIEHLNEAVSLDPKRFDAYRAFAQIYEIQQDWSKAQAQYEKVAELEPELQIDMRLRIGQLFLAQQNPEGAENQFSQVKGEELKPDDRRVELLTAGYLETASLYRKQGKLDAMRKACAEVISLVEKLQPTSHHAFRQLGFAHFMNGESAEAARVLRRVLEAEPADAKARLYLALNFLLEGDVDKAQSELKLAIENARQEDDYIYAIEEAEVLAARVPELAGAREMLKALREASQKLKE